MYRQQLSPSRVNPRHSLPQNNKATEARSVVTKAKCPTFKTKKHNVDPETREEQLPFFRVGGGGKYKQVA